MFPDVQVKKTFRVGKYGYFCVEWNIGRDDTSNDRSQHLGFNLYLLCGVEQVIHIHRMAEEQVKVLHVGDLNVKSLIVKQQPTHDKD